MTLPIAGRLAALRIVCTTTLILAACQEKGGTPAGDTAALPAPGEASATASPDAEFLAMMVGHHQGMLAMAEVTMALGTGQAKADAQAMHHAQSAERDRMSEILSTRYLTMITPAVSEKARMMTDSLTKLTGARQSHAFYDMTIEHHREGIAMIDDFLPRLTGEVRAMAEGMRADQTAEIAAFRVKAGDAH